MSDTGGFDNEFQESKLKLCPDKKLTQRNVLRCIQDGQTKKQILKEYRLLVKHQKDYTTVIIWAKQLGKGKKGENPSPMEQYHEN